MNTQFKAAVIQLCTSNDAIMAFAELEEQVRAAAKAGAKLILTPEGSNFLERDPSKFAQICPLETDAQVLNQYQKLAKELGIILIIGSALFRRENAKAANRCLVFNENGELISQYDKIHLFDVNLGAGMELQESKTYAPGQKAVIANTNLGDIGLSICYDVRFPHLYRALAQYGAKIITIPAAFTVPTGRAHWEILLRARAIETGAFILAAAQAGSHKDGRQTYGHSMIISPWGEILTQMDGTEIGFAMAEIDLRLVDEARRKIPAWGLNQGFDGP
ncbi:MAG: nitrilase/cyanide hydratase and apolipoprotein N-acyltransferase [Hyphomonadaceae bacterium]|nr:MAG: nitrilase/cyanide hydratase and apolipoprotein N-acyltransferase [Hyphomonadaceae bacterium]KAF0184855.1 MAG: nitrilase/cyanide hydratase and apolipoprotein N-acyltransferase [Hyphomonadaceae bacterium]